MRRTATFALVAALAATAALAQAPQTVRLRGVIEKVDGNKVTAKSDKGDALTLNLADKMLVVAVVKASMADIKDGRIHRQRSDAAARRLAEGDRGSHFCRIRCAAPAKVFGPGMAHPTAP